MYAALRIVVRLQIRGHHCRGRHSRRKVYGRNDEKLGTIDDVIFNHSSGDITYIVVDTGGCFFKQEVPGSSLSLAHFYTRRWRLFSEFGQGTGGNSAAIRRIRPEVAEAVAELRKELFRRLARRASAAP